MLLETKGTGTNDPNKEAASTEKPFDSLKTLESITSGLGNIVKSNFDFLAHMEGNVLKLHQALDTLRTTFDTLETQVGKLSAQFGGARSLADSIRQSIADAVPSVVELGGTIDDVVKIQSGVIKGLQTQTILNKDAYAELFAVAKLTTDGTKDVGAATGDMIRKFADAGYGLYNVGREMTDIIGKAREYGTTSVALMGELEKGIGKLNLYNFSNGIQGMAEMAAQAATLRIDMASTLKVADDLFDPDKAFDMAASFQRLGVQVTSLLDPYKLMDMARNDPAKLQDAIIDATKQLTYFDEKNQRMAIMPGAQGQLRELAAAMGIPKEQLAQMAISASDMERKMKEIKFSPDFADDKSQKMVASMAQLKDGKYQITFDDEKGNSITKAVEDLTKQDKERLEKMAEKGPATAIDLQKEANGYLRNVDNSLKAMQGILPTQIAASTTFNEKINKLASFTSSGIEAASRSMLGTGRGKKGELTIDNTKAVIGKVGEGIGEMFHNYMTTGSMPTMGDISKLGEEVKKSGMIDLSKFEKYFEQEEERKSKLRGEKPNYDKTKLNDFIEHLKKGFTTTGINPTLPATNTPAANVTTPAANTNVTPPANTTPPASTNTYGGLSAAFFATQNTPTATTNTPNNQTTDVTNAIVSQNASIVDIANTMSNDYKQNIDLQNKSLASLKNIDKNTAQISPTGLNTIQNKTLTDLATNITNGNKNISDIQNQILSSSKGIEKNTSVSNTGINTIDNKTLTDLATIIANSNKINTDFQNQILALSKNIVVKPTEENKIEVFKTEEPKENKVTNKNIVTTKTEGITPGMKSEDREKMITPSLVTSEYLRKMNDFFAAQENIEKNKIPEIKLGPLDIKATEITKNTNETKPQVVATPAQPVTPTPNLQNVNTTTASVTNNVPLNMEFNINLTGQGLSQAEIKAIVNEQGTIAYQNIQAELERKMQSKGIASSYNTSLKNQV